jgi:hypothetical protein
MIVMIVMSRRHYDFIFLNFFAHEMTQLNSLIPFVDSLLTSHLRVKLSILHLPILVLEGKTEYIYFSSVRLVVGMTYRAYHGPSNMTAGVQESPRLQHEKTGSAQPAGDSTEESRSWAMKAKASQRLFRRKWDGPNKSDRGQGWE